MPVTVISTRAETWMRPIPLLHGPVWSSVGDKGLCSSNPGVRTAQGAACGRHMEEDWIRRGLDGLGSQKNLPRRNSLWPASWGVVVDGKGVRGLFLLEKEQTIGGMLSKGTIYLEMCELGASPRAQGVYVEAAQVRLWDLLCHAPKSGHECPVQDWQVFQEVHCGSSEEGILESRSELRQLFQKQVVRKDNLPSVNLLSATPEPQMCFFHIVIASSATHYPSENG